MIRSIIFVAMSFAVSAAHAEITVGQIASSLITTSNQTNEYSGVTPKGISCGASLQIRDGQLQGSATWGDSGAGAKASLTGAATATRGTDGALLITMIDDQNPESSMTLTVKNAKVLTMKFTGQDSFLLIPYKTSLICGELEQFIPKN